MFLEVFSQRTWVSDQGWALDASNHGRGRASIITILTRETFAVRSRKTIVLVATLIVVVVGAVLVLYFGGGIGQKFTVSGLTVTNYPSLGYGTIDFTLSNKNNIPITSLEVSANTVDAIPLGFAVSSSNPISPGQSGSLSYNVVGGVVQGQSYTIRIAVGFGDGTFANYSATVVAG